MIKQWQKLLWVLIGIEYRHFHPKEFTFKCTESDCEFVTDSDYKLKQHINGIHLQLRPFKCEICQAAFKRKYHLTVHHQGSHSSGEAKKHKCDKCDFATHLPRSLKIHIGTVHLGQRPYKCEACGKTFTQRSHLNTHRKSVHQNIRPHSCDFCESTFTTRQALDVHKKGVHDDHETEPEYKCDSCNFQTHYRDSLKKHKKAKHEANEKDEECPECGKCYEIKANLITHLKNVH